jgi:RNA polymerase sigma factor (sigma-70 family)
LPRAGRGGCPLLLRAESGYNARVMSEERALTDELVRAAAEGREPARSRLLEWLQPQVGQMVAARLAPTPRQLDLLDDITQQVLADLLEALPQLVNRTVRGLRAYLSALVSHKVADALKPAPNARGQRPPASLNSTVFEMSTAGPLWQFLSASSTSPSGKAEWAELAERLIRELGQLKDEYREIIILAFFDELLMRDAGLRMGKSPSAASMLLLRAVATLRSNMGGERSGRRADGRAA